MGAHKRPRASALPGSFFRSASEPPASGVGPSPGIDAPATCDKVQHPASGRERDSRQRGNSNDVGARSSGLKPEQHRTIPKCGSGMGALSKVQAHVLWRSTDTQLDVMAARVREGVEVLAASEFARWLQNSGVLQVLLPCEAGFPLPCRASELQQKTELLLRSCGEWFTDHERSNIKPEPTVPRSQLEAINEQLRNINATLGELTNESHNASKVA